MEVRSGFTGEKCDAEDFICCIGIGWQPIVRQLFVDMFAAGWNGEVSQVKEKFGGLRVYINNAPDEVHDLIEAAEAVCDETCEDCGKPGKSRHGGWIKTLCDECCGMSKGGVNAI